MADKDRFEVARELAEEVERAVIGSSDDTLTRATKQLERMFDDFTKEAYAGPYFKATAEVKVLVRTDGKLSRQSITATRFFTHLKDAIKCSRYVYNRVDADEHLDYTIGEVSAAHFFDDKGSHVGYMIFKGEEYYSEISYFPEVEKACEELDRGDNTHRDDINWLSALSRFCNWFSIMYRSEEATTFRHMYESAKATYGSEPIKNPEFRAVFRNAIEVALRGEY